MAVEQLLLVGAGDALLPLQRPRCWELQPQALFRSSASGRLDGQHWAEASGTLESSRLARDPAQQRWEEHTLLMAEARRGQSRWWEVMAALRLPAAEGQATARDAHQLASPRLLILSMQGVVPDPLKSLA